MSEGRARLFVALELPASVRHALLDWREDAFASITALRLIPAVALHLTLCFLGSCPVDELDAIAAASAAVASTGPAGLRLAGAIWLPVRRPNVVAVTIADPSGELGRLQTALADALHAGGWYQPEQRPYLPHVTVARVRRGQRVRPVELGPPSPVSLDRARLTLFRSRLDPAGPRYEALR